MIGLGLAFAAIVISTIMDGNSFGALIGPSSLVLVLLGAIGATISGFEMSDVTKIGKSVIIAFTGKPLDPDGFVTTMMKFAETARREGVLALEAKLNEVEDPFLKSSLQLVIDGVDNESVRAILETELDAIEERHQTQIALWKGFGGNAPTLGMLGTVIGLINMLQNLSDPDQLGIGMSLALLTTLYGVLFANLLFLPIAGKLERLHNIEMNVKDLIIEGTLAIHAGSSPRLLVERLEARIDPKLRVGHQARAKGATAEAA